MHHGCSCLFYAKLVNRFTKESNPEPSLLTLWDTGKWQTRASLTFSMLMDQIDEKRTKPNITSKFHSFGSTGVHREVCSTKAKQRWWMVPFIHSFNCSPLAGSGSLHFPRHNCWLLNWLVTWVFTFAEPRSLLPDDTKHDYFSWMAVVCIIILKRTDGRGYAQKLYRVVYFWLKTWLFLSCECVAYLLFPECIKQHCAANCKGLWCKPKSSSFVVALKSKPTILRQFILEVYARFVGCHCLPSRL